jgi:subtilisin family serine protease
MRTAITVAAMDTTDTRAPFSNFGSCVDIFAPGVNIVSSMVSGDYGLMSGTSMATPLVAGAVAMLRQVRCSRAPRGQCTVQCLVL